jgi:hypothetical protein
MSQELVPYSPNISGAKRVANRSNDSDSDSESDAGEVEGISDDPSHPNFDFEKHSQATF